MVAVPAAGWFEQSDYVRTVLVSQWIPRFGFANTVEITRVPPRGELVIEFLGTSVPLAASVLETSFWGAISAGQRISNYSRVPGGVSLGTVTVPILTAKTVIDGGRDLTVFTTELPGDAVQVRIRARTEAAQPFQDPRPPPLPTPFERVLGFLVGIGARR